MTYVALYRDQSGTLHQDLDEERLTDALRDTAGMLWLHLSHFDDDDASLLERVFNFHPLAIRDCLDATYQRPKVDDYGDYLFVMLHGIDQEATYELVETTELDLFVGPNYVVSSSLGQLPGIERLVERTREQPHRLERGAALMAHNVIDILVDEMAPTIDRMGEVADAVEEEALEDPRHHVMDAIMRLKRSALRVHRIVAPQRDVLQRLGRGEFAQLGPDVAPYLRDVYDHLVRIEDLVQMLRERADNALTIYLSSVSIRQNETMRALSIVAAIFLPLALVTGVYGMNFDHMPELHWRLGYFGVLIGMAVYAAAIFYWFWARTWIAVGRRRVRRILDFAVEPPLIREASTEAMRLREWVFDRAGLGSRRNDDRPS